MEDEKIIVSMTSWKNRIGNIPSVLDSILDNTKKPDLICINLSLLEFPEKENSLPQNVYEYINRHSNIIKLIWEDGNTKQWKKFIPTMKLFPNDCVICIDDDKIYQKDLIEALWKKHLKYPDSPIRGGRYMFKGIPCHSGPCSLVKFKFFNDIDDYLCEEIYKLHSSDMFFTWLALKNGYDYISLDKNYEFTAKVYNEISPMHSEKTNGNKPMIMWQYLTRKYPNKIQVKNNQCEKAISKIIPEVKTNTLRKRIATVNKSRLVKKTTIHKIMGY